MFNDHDISKVMSYADITADHLPSDSDARDIVRAAIATGVLLGVTGFHITDEGDYIAVIERDGHRCITTTPISTRYLWKSGLRGASAVADMLRNVHNEATIARALMYPVKENEK